MSETQKPQSYIPVRLVTLRKGDVVDFDVFIRVGERLLHYLRQNDPFDADRMDSLRSKGVLKLFIPLEHEPAYLGYLDSGLSRLQDAALDLGSKVDLAQNSLMNLSGHAIKSIENEHKYQAMEGRMQKILSFVQSEKGIAGKILKQSGIAQDEMQHAANVTTLSMLLAEKRGITQTKDLLTLSIAALMHDIGKVDLPLDHQIPAEKLGKRELEVYRSHPKRGAEKMMDKPYINSTIVSMILYHEEIGDGAGFPDRKRIQTLPPLQQILNLCNNYDRMCINEGLDPSTAIKRYFMDRLGMFPLDLIQSLSEALKLQP